MLPLMVSPAYEIQISYAAIGDAIRESVTLISLSTEYKVREAHLFYVFIKSLQKIFEINRNLKQIRSITKDTEMTSSLEDINTVRDILPHALKRIEFVISEVGQHKGHTSSYVEISRLRDGLKDLREIKCCVKEMFISLKLLLNEFQAK